MLSLTRKADYALVALVYLGHRWCQQAGPASAREIAESFGLPLPLLMNVLKELAHAGLIRSTRGSSGGYEMALPPDRVSLLDVVTTLEGEGEADADAPADDAHPVLHRLHRRIDGFLGNLTLDDLLRGADEPEGLVPLRTREPSSRSDL